MPALGDANVVARGVLPRLTICFCRQCPVLIWIAWHAPGDEAERTHAFMRQGPFSRETMMIAISARYLDLLVDRWLDQ